MIRVARLYGFGGRDNPGISAEIEPTLRYLVRPFIGEVSSCPIHGTAWPMRLGGRP